MASFGYLSVQIWLRPFSSLDASSFGPILFVLCPILICKHNSEFRSSFTLTRIKKLERERGRGHGPSRKPVPPALADAETIVFLERERGRDTKKRFRSTPVDPKANGPNQPGEGRNK